MTKFWIVAAAGALLAGPALAAAHLGSGDPEAGKAVFNQCQTCHVVANEAGETLAGRNAKTGPNLYGVVGRTAGTQAEFAAGRPGYKASIIAAGEKGLVWDEATFVAYVQDPTAFLKEYLGDSKARSGMAFKVRSEEDAKNLYAFLASIGPAPTN